MVLVANKRCELLVNSWPVRLITNLPLIFSKVSCWGLVLGSAFWTFDEISETALKRSCMVDSSLSVAGRANHAVTVALWRSVSCFDKSAWAVDFAAASLQNKRAFKSDLQFERFWAYNGVCSRWMSELLMWSMPVRMLSFALFRMSPVEMNL